MANYFRQAAFIDFARNRSHRGFLIWEASEVLQISVRTVYRYINDSEYRGFGFLFAEAPDENTKSTRFWLTRYPKMEALHVEQ